VHAGTGVRRCFCESTLFLRIQKYSTIPVLVPNRFLECSHYANRQSGGPNSPPPAKPLNRTSFHFPTWLPPQFCTDTGSKTWTTGFETDSWFFLVVCGSEIGGAGLGSFCASPYSIAYPTSPAFMRFFNDLQKEASSIHRGGE
jgi:hypothetical protein